MKIIFVTGIEVQTSNWAMEGEDDARTVQGRQGNVTFRPYLDIKTKPLLKRKLVELDDVDEDGGKEEVEGPTMAEHLYPELLCHIFSMLDTESKGRVAQVNKALSNVLLVRKSS